MIIKKKAKEKSITNKKPSMNTKKDKECFNHKYKNFLLN